MDLIDRYLHAVRDYLPGKSQDDIVSELGDDIRAQATDREEELGRPLTSDDQAVLLKRFGHPMLLAAKYRPTQHLISPVVFPYYATTLKISIGIAVLVQVAVAIATAAGGHTGAEIIGRLASFPFTGLVTLFGWITIGFALVDMHVRQIATRVTDAWDPRTLAEPKRRAGSKPPWELAIEHAISTVFLFWWLALPSQPFLIFGPAAAFLALAPAFHAIHLPVALAWLAGLAARWTLLFRPDLSRLRFTVEVGSATLTIVIALYLLNVDALVVPGASAPAGMSPAQVGRIVDGVNVAGRITMVVILATAVWGLAQAFWSRRRS